MAGTKRAQEMMTGCGLFPDMANVDVNVDIKDEDENVKEQMSEGGPIDSDGYDADCDDNDDDDDEDRDQDDEKDQLLSINDASVDGHSEGKRIFWDENDQVARCCWCSWEVVGGVCQGVDCHTVFDIDEVSEQFPHTQHRTK